MSCADVYLWKYTHQLESQQVGGRKKIAEKITMIELHKTSVFGLTVFR